MLHGDAVKRAPALLFLAAGLAAGAALVWWLRERPADVPLPAGTVEGQDALAVQPDLMRADRAPGPAEDPAVAPAPAAPAPRAEMRGHPLRLCAIDVAGQRVYGARVEVLANPSGMKDEDHRRMPPLSIATTDAAGLALVEVPGPGVLVRIHKAPIGSTGTVRVGRERIGVAEPWELRLTPPWRIHGRVLAADGPVPHATVHAEPVRGPQGKAALLAPRLWTRAHEDGSFGLRVFGPGRYRVWATLDRRASESVTVTAGPAPEGEVLATPVFVDGPLVVGTLRTTAGAPAVGRIRVQSLPPGTAQATEAVARLLVVASGNDGRFLVPLTGPCRLNLEPEDADGRPGVARVLDVTAEQRRVEVELRVPEVRTLRLRVLRAGGTPLAGAHVSVGYDPDALKADAGERIFFASQDPILKGAWLLTTDAAGRIEIPGVIADRGFGVRIQPIPARPTLDLVRTFPGVPEEEATVVVQEAELDRVELRVTLQLPRHLARGSIRAWVAGAMGGFEFASGTSDGSETVFRELPRGRACWLTLETSSSTPSSVRALPIEIVGSSGSSLNFGPFTTDQGWVHLVPDTLVRGSLEVALRDAQGRGVAGAYVWVTPAIGFSRNNPGAVVSDANGIATFADLARGPYTLRVVDPVTQRTLYADASVLGTQTATLALTVPR